VAVSRPSFLSEPHDCEYLPGATAQTAYRLLVDPTPDELGHLLARGWRRFGPIAFRPACETCAECVPLRIPVATFRPSRSQRRARNRCASLVCEMSVPVIDDERLALYARWHAGREAARGWDASPLGAEDYARSFVARDACARELSYRDAGKLVAVGICDDSDDALSAAYFFHDPAYARFSPGVNHVLELIERARAAGKAYVYLGFRVMGCASMRYKASFRPHQLLEGRPDDAVSPRWLGASSSSTLGSAAKLPGSSSRRS
jgi:leucyl-tRNA---protein transferase